jgi:putative thioredoxin
MESPYIHDGDEADFAERVIARSAEVPVVVDFWAAWCSPCRVLGPLLEREVAALGGRVELVKVDTDRNPELSTRYRVRGIPAVMAFRDGQLVDEFVGAQGAAFVREFLARLAPSEERRALELAMAARARGEREEAERLAREVIAAVSATVTNGGAGDEELLSEAALLRAELLLEAGRAADAEAALAQVAPRSALADQADLLRAVLALGHEAEALGGEAAARARAEKNPDDLEAKYALGLAHAAHGDWRNSLDALLDVVAGSKARRAAAKTAMVAILSWLGDDDLAREYRRRLQVVS